jgi:hypothetical protein
MNHFTPGDLIVAKNGKQFVLWSHDEGAHYDGSFNSQQWIKLALVICDYRRFCDNQGVGDYEDDFTTMVIVGNRVGWIWPEKWRLAA